jgi:hypothetical protein
MRAGEVYTDGDLENILAAAALAAVAVAVGISPDAIGERLAPFDMGRLNAAVRR